MHAKQPAKLLRPAAGRLGKPVAELFDWQVASANQLHRSLLRHGIGADGSEMGTGKTYKICDVARRMNRSLVVICPKSVVPDWKRVAELFGVQATVINIEKVRTGKTPLGRWAVKARVFEWSLPPGALLVFDEAHKLGGQGTQNSKLLIAAVRVRLTTVLASGTLLMSPLKAYAIGFALGLHNLTDYWRWAYRNGVEQGFYGPEFDPKRPESIAVMENIRRQLGDKFTRIRKVDVPGFPVIQNIPTFVETKEMPDLESGFYSMEARTTVELLKVPGLVERTKSLVEDGYSVAIFVNFRASLSALYEEFPDAVLVYGGQSATEREIAINRFQQNEAFVCLLMLQAGGTGVSLHDLHGRPRAALVCPGYDPTDFVQSLSRIHRAGALSPAINYVVFASGVPVERRIRDRLEARLSNLDALNDADLAGTDSTHGNAHTRTSASDNRGAAEDAVPSNCDEPRRGESGVGRSGRGDQVSGPVREHTASSGDHIPMTTRRILPLPTDIPATVINNGAVAPGEHAKRKHARCSPSKIVHQEICPSYESEEKEGEEPHPVTKRGTVMHEALETGNDSRLNDAEGREVGGDEVELVRMCREFTEGETVPGETVILEPHIKTHDPDVKGFVDRLVLLPRDANGRRKARIRDYKFSFKEVHPADINRQAIAYTVGVFIEYPDVDEVDFAFLIPRLDTILQHTFVRADLPRLKLLISTIAERVRAHYGRVFNVVESNCLYCTRKANCDALNAKMLTIANGHDMEDKLPLPAQFNPELVQSPEELAYMLNAARIVSDWAEKVNAFALRYRLELGQEIPGYDLVERRGKREVVNPTAAWQVARDEFGVTDEEFIASARLSIISLDASVRAHAPDGQKDQAAKRFTERLSDVMALTRGGSFHVLQKSRKRRPKAVAPALPNHA